MLKMIKRFEKNLIGNKLINKGEKILLGVSGGPDSLTMLDLFDKVKSEYNLKLYVFHLDHCFRTEAKKEALTVKKISEKRNITSFIKEFDVPKYARDQKLSPEEAARKIRFNFLSEIVQKYEIDKVGLAHNKDDHIETILLNIFRGTGLKGLRGIADAVKIKKMQIIHPLLIFYRSEILDYLNYNELSFVQDPSNKSNLYTRNRIRNKIIPIIEKQVNPRVKQSLDRLSKTVSEDFEFLKEYSEEKFQELIIDRSDCRIVLDLDGLKLFDKVIIKRVIDIGVRKLKSNIENFYYKNYQDIFNFVRNAESGKILDLPGEIKLKVSYKKLIIKKGDFKEVEDYFVKINKEGKYELPFKQSLDIKVVDHKLDWRKYKDDKNTVLIDYKKIKYPLYLRNRNEGDQFIPLGMKGHKKIKDFFIDQKVPDYQRDKVPILFNNDDQIIWICGFRMDERFKVDKSTQRILFIKYDKEDLTSDE